MTATVIPSGPGGAVLSEVAGPPFWGQRATRRFLLWRIWKRHADRMLFVCFNPSTADALTDDPTVRRLVGFAQREGCGGFELVNLISQRATDPSDVRAEPEPDLADAYIRDALTRCARVVAAWGRPSIKRDVTPLAIEREAFVIVAAEDAGRELVCLGFTAEGLPRHPLFVKRDAPLRAYPRSPF
jgi:hypothetical protein